MSSPTRRLSGALPCSPVLDDRNGRPATQVFDHVLANRISQLRIRQFRSCPPVRPYKANVGFDRALYRTVDFSRVGW
jgi:hypothetical protein